MKPLLFAIINEMKKEIHPKVYKNAKIVDNSSGEVFEIMSTVEKTIVEISSLTHPFYTGEQKILDTDNRVDRFKKKLEKANSEKVKKKKKKKVARKKSSVSKVEKKETVSLKDMLKGLK